jgi:hypothetical protein
MGVDPIRPCLENSSCCCVCQRSCQDMSNALTFDHLTHPHMHHPFDHPQEEDVDDDDAMAGGVGHERRPRSHAAHSLFGPSDTEEDMITHDSESHNSACFFFSSFYYLFSLFLSFSLACSLVCVCVRVCVFNSHTHK